MSDESKKRTRLAARITRRARKLIAAVAELETLYEAEQAHRQDEALVVKAMQDAIAQMQPVYSLAQAYKATWRRASTATDASHTNDKHDGHVNDMHVARKALFAAIGDSVDIESRGPQVPAEA